MMHHARAYPEYLTLCLLHFYCNASENIVFSGTSFETFPETVTTLYFGKVQPIHLKSS